MTWDRVQATIITAAAVAVAAVLVHREFIGTTPVATPRRQPQPVAAWRDILPAGRVIGNPNAKVMLIEFADLECPFCRRFQSTLNQATAKYPNDVALVFVHLPLEMHRFSRYGAKMAECAAAQGRFRNMVDAIYQRQDSLGLRPRLAYALDAGLGDTVAFRRCVADTTTPPMVAKGLAAARKLSLTATPTLLLNNWRFGGVPSDSELYRAIEDVLAGREPFRE